MRLHRWPTIALMLGVALATSGASAQPPAAAPRPALAADPLRPAMAGARLPVDAAQPASDVARTLPAQALRPLPAQARVAVRSVPGLVQQVDLRSYVRMHRDVLDLDRHGAPIVRSEILAIDPSPAALERARAAGFAVTGTRELGALGLRVAVLHARPGQGTRAALRQLQRLDRDGEYVFNHLYFGSSAPVAIPATSAPSAPGAAGTPLRIGLVDSGVDRTHPALAGVRIEPWGCDGDSRPDRHGTAVASLLAGGDRDATPTVLYAADIYCGRPTGGAVSALVEAMAWLADERVAVINLSLVGPDNALLARATRALAGRGHVLVAAVGNDGPTAPPLFPAAYPEVIGVTAVDARQRALPEAVRGPQVDFAAPGAALRAARPGGDWATVRGTSFAAPLVARAAARHAAAPGEGLVEHVRTQLAAQAIDLGERGRDPVFGHGLIDAEAALALTEAGR
ncbi:MAG: S8 family serine peptidase [Rehaibacterium terrae]|uniref:S8 family serine peptidase n=1 Tax=Rehaibacterium terrae TaxID=1341696 RepID=UPI0039192B9C